MLSGVQWPLPQTGQMWLEHELLKNPKVPGFFCLTTSYRDEPQPNAERHLKILPLFEFETHGDITVLRDLIASLLEYIGFGDKVLYKKGDYQSIADKYQVETLEAEHEKQIDQDFGPVFFLEKFPQYTHPFFNMKKSDKLFNKIDAILYGIETIGSAERSTNVDEMRELFHTISDGEHANSLYKYFGKKRVDEELDSFFTHKFFPRCGGGIGLTRLMRALYLSEQPKRYTTLRQTHSVFQSSV